MLTCSDYQSLMLDYLYDLVEGDERRALEAHAGECPGCQAALRGARHQQHLLALAAKTGFPEVRFQPPGNNRPAPEAKPGAEPLAEPVRKRPARPTWVLWAVAATVLLAVAGLGLPLGVLTLRSAPLQAEFAQVEAEVEHLRVARKVLATLRQNQIDEAQEEVTKANALVPQVQQNWQQKQAEVLRKARERQLKVVVSGPEALQPGAQNRYRIATRTLNEQPVATTVLARVLDADKKVVYQEEARTPSGTMDLNLPANLPLTPGNKLSLEVVARRDDGQKKDGGEVRGELRQELTLANPVYLTHLATDKPMYQPGETVHFRSLTLERFSLRPADEEFRLAYSVTNPNGEEVFHKAGAARLADGQGTTLTGPDRKPLRGLGAGEFPLSPEARGGEYTLTVREEANRFAPQTRKFIVNQYELAPLNKELDFSKKSYGPGEEVSALCKVARVEGGAPLANCLATATVVVDGKRYGADGKENGPPLVLRTDAKGHVVVRAKLPAAPERGLGTLSVKFEAPGVVDTLVRPIPIVLKKLDVEFFPEGGDLVAGVPNRVYFQVRNTLGKPADLQGRVVDQDGKAVAEGVATLTDAEQPVVNQGLGRFTLTPVAGRRYELKIDHPVGVEGRYPLPNVRAGGVVLSAPGEVTAGKEPVTVTVQSAERDRRLLVGAYCRGRLLDHQEVTARAGAATTVRLSPSLGVGGVYRVTVFEQRPGNGQRPQLVPVAERLVYRKPAESLLITAKPDKERYVPGEQARVSFKALTEDEAPAPAVLLVGVVNKTTLTMADEKTHRGLPTHFLLTQEVRRPEDLEYADVLLGGHPKATATLDLLLGTQGWRRFAEQEPGKFREMHKEEADRLLVLNGQGPDRVRDQIQEELRQAQATFQAELAAAQEKQKKAETKLVAVNNDVLVPGQQQDAEQRLTVAIQKRAQLNAELDEYGKLTATVLSYALPVLGVVFLVAALVLLIHGIASRSGVSFPTLIGGAVCGLLLLGVVGAYLLTERGKPGAVAMTGGAANPQAEAAGGGMPPPMMPAPKAVEKRAMREDMPVPLALPADGGAPAAGLQFGGGAFPGGMPPPPGPAGAPGGFGGGFAGGPRGPGGAGAPGNEARFFNLPAAPPGDALGLLQENKDKQLLEKRMNLGRDGAAFRQDGFGGRQAQDRGRAAGDKKEMAAMEVELKARVAPQKPGAARAILRGGGGDRGAEAAQLQDQIAEFQRAQPGGRPGVGGGGRGEALMGGLRGLEVAPRAAVEVGAKGGDFGVNLGEEFLVLPEPLVVREYAHQNRSTAPGETRSDFTETVYWHPALVLPDGSADVNFQLADAVTTYQVTAYGHTAEGRLGALTTTLEARKPYVLDPKIPIEVTAGDRVGIPVGVANNTAQEQALRLQLETSGLNLLQGNQTENLSLKADGRTRQVYELKPTLQEGTARLRTSLLLDGQNVPADSVERTIAVVPEGFPVVGARSDVLEKLARHDVDLPPKWIPGTLKLQATAYPSTLADLQKGLESLLREPNGCFEQTSTTNYPNVLVLDYLRESDQANPAAVRRANELLARGYQKLTSFECQNTAKNLREGYEWFGGAAPPHEALTAYGLMQFRDMARVYEVDPNMVQRTRTYLLSARDGNGGFKRNARALDTFGRAPEQVTNAYIVWSLTEGGKEDDVTRELDALADQAKSSKDPYFLALVANSLLNRDRADEAAALLRATAELQKPDGHLDAATTSITGSGGRDLQIETTALAVLGWLKANRPADFNKPVQAAVKWIGQQRGGYGGFGSTQATILALKALIAHTRANKKTAESGEFKLFVGGQPAGQVRFEANVQDALALNVPDAEKLLRPGKNEVRLEMTGDKNVFPYTLTWTYQVETPPSAEKCPVRLTTKLDRAEAGEGDTVQLSVTLTNTVDQGQGMAVAIIGLPAGLTLPEDMKQLKDHARQPENGRGLISAWETRGRELILYWRDLAPKQQIEVPLSLICRVPGTYGGPASRAYLYYNADHKHWVEPLRVTIAAKAE